MWFGIWILSLLLSMVLLPLGFIYSIVVALYKNKFFAEGLPNINNKFKRLSTAVDIYGNVACSELFNHILIKKNTNHLFGHYGETISFVIGMNKVENTLSKTGVVLDKILDFFDKNHSIKAIENENFTST